MTLCPMFMIACLPMAILRSLYKTMTCGTGQVSPVLVSAKSTTWYDAIHRDLHSDDGFVRSSSAS